MKGYIISIGLYHSDIGVLEKYRIYDELICSDELR